MFIMGINNYEQAECIKQEKIFIFHFLPAVETSCSADLSMKIVLLSLGVDIGIVI